MRFIPLIWIAFAADLELLAEGSGEAQKCFTNYILSELTLHNITYLQKLYKTELLISYKDVHLIQNVTEEKQEMKFRKINRMQIFK